MGGGHVSRPDFGKTHMNADDPMSEFYALLLQGLEQADAFATPGCYAQFKPDFSRQIYREDMPEYCRYSAEPGRGTAVIEPGRFAIGHFELSLTALGAPATVFLYSQDHRRELAVRLLPPFGGVELPKPPVEVPLVELELTEQDLMLIDAKPERLAQRWVNETQHKHWAASPVIDAWELKALAAAQKEYARLHRL